MRYVIIVLFLLLSACSCYEDACFMEKAIVGNKDEVCTNIKDTVTRDYCYLFLAIEHNAFNRLDPDPACQNIEGLLQKFLCIRIQYRPHMVQFMTRIETEKSLELAHAFSDGNCSGLEARYKDECSYYSVIRQVLDRDFEKAERLCENMTYPAWKSECYFTIADEINHDKPNLPEMTRLCEMSDASHDFNCDDHQCYSLKPEEIIIYSNLQDKKARLKCMILLGERLYQGNFQELLERCSNITETTEDASTCLQGGIFNLGRSIDISRCQQIAGNQRDSCFNGVFNEIYNNADNAHELIDECGGFHEDIREKCYIYMAERFGFFEAFKTDVLIDFCNDMPTNYRSSCLTIVAKYLYVYDYDNNMKSTRCQLLPEEYQQYC